MLCKSCGKKVDINKKFCTNCGWKIEVPIAKEEVKKVIPKEPIQEVKRINKDESVAREEALLKNEFDNFKSGIKKQSKKNNNFFNNFSSNLKKQSVPIKDEKNQLIEAVKPIKKQELSGAIKENLKNNKKFSILIVSLGAVFIGLVGVIVSNDSFWEDKYVQSNNWFKDYLDSDGNCCSDEYYSETSRSSRSIIINDILQFNPDDSEALKELEIINENLIQRKKQDSIKNFGDYSIDLASIKVDKDFFWKNKDITYIAEVFKKNKRIDYFGYSFSCSNRKKFDWDKGKWKYAKNDELGMIKSICRSKKYDPELISLLRKEGWKEYSTSNKSAWVDLNSWEVIKGEGYINYETNYYFPTKQTHSKIAVNCSRKEVAFLQADEWTDWETSSDTYRQILEDKCYSSNNEILKIPY